MLDNNILENLKNYHQLLPIKSFKIYGTEYFFKQVLFLEEINKSHLISRGNLNNIIIKNTFIHGNKNQEISFLRSDYEKYSILTQRIIQYYLKNKVLKFRGHGNYEILK